MTKWVFQVRTYRTAGFHLAVVLLLGLPCALVGGARLAQHLRPWVPAGMPGALESGEIDAQRAAAWGALFLFGLFVLLHRRSVIISGRLMQMRVGWGRPTLYWGSPLFLHSAGRVSLEKPVNGRGRYLVLVEMEDGSRVPVTEFRDEIAARKSYEDIKEFLQGTLYVRPARPSNDATAESETRAAS